MTAHEPFDRELRRTRRNRAALLWSHAAPLVSLVEEELFERLALVTRRFERALVLNGGFGGFAPRLREQVAAVTVTDHGSGFGPAVLRIDEDRIDFPPASFDLVLAPTGLESVNDLPGALLQIRRALAPDGLFLGTMIGAGSLSRLRSAMFAADEAEGRPASPHVHPQVDLKSAGDLLGRAGFALPVVDSISFDLRYPTLRGLVADLRALGGTNVLHARPLRPFGRLGLAAAEVDFLGNADADGKTRERIELLVLTAWSPSPDQPKPARRGSGSRSLAAALRPPAS